MDKNKNVVFVAIGIAAFGLILYLVFVALKGNYWAERYSLNKDEPYDLNIFKTLVDSAVKGQSDVLYTSIKELPDSTAGKTLMFMGYFFYADSIEALEILDFIERGNTVFICARNTSYDLLYALDSNDQIGDTEYHYNTSAEAWFVDQSSPKKYTFEFRDAYGPSRRYWTYFEDSTEIGKNIKTLGSFDTDSASGMNNFRKVTIGKGQLFVHTEPLLFSNLYLLKKDGFQYASHVIKYLPHQPIIWDQYHQDYHDESGEGASGKTPMKFVMQNPPLKYAWYTILCTALLFVLFRSKRQQRIIPLIPRVENTSIAFAQSLGALYYQAASGQYLAIELMKLFDHFNRRRFGIKRKKENTDMASEIAKKAKVPLGLVESILTLERQIVYNPSSKIKDNVQLYMQLNEYYKRVKK